LFQRAIFYAQLITGGRCRCVHRFLETRAEFLLALCDRAPDGILIGSALGGEANRFRVDRVSRAAEFRGVLKSTFMPPPHLDAESLDGDAPRSCRNDKVDGDSRVL